MVSHLDEFSRPGNRHAKIRIYNMGEGAGDKFEKF
jgi:hypothetical protein